MKTSLKQTLLSLLLLDNNLSGADISKKTGLSRAAISKAIKSLKEEGYLIESRQGGSYTFLGDGDVLNRDIITSYFKTPFGKSIDILEDVDSTNLYIKRLLPHIKEGHVVVAASQSAGMGRKGRAFCSPKGGLYFSVLLKPSLAVSKVHYLTFCAAVAVCRSLEEICDFKPDIKWVNDIFFGGKKLAGISTDTTFSAELMGIDSVVIGIGINLDGTPSEVNNIATDIKTITGKVGFKNRLLASILNNLYTTTKELYEHGIGNIITEYKNHCFILGKEIIVHDVNEEYKATAKDITLQGGLLIKRNNGASKILSFAEVSIGASN